MAGCTEQAARLCHARSHFGARNPKVHDVSSAALVQHDVLGLEVAMNYAFGMGSFQCPADLSNDVGCLGRLELFLAAKNALQILAFDVFHRNELDPIAFP